MNNYKQSIWGLIYSFLKFINKAGISKRAIKKIPFIGKAVDWEDKPFPPVSLKLLKYMKPAVYGLDMYQAIKDSKICLNIHADSSYKYASNMRMFEITGVGSCMIVDWKSNIKELFEPEKEIVTYKSPEECTEKIKWLLSNQEKMKEISENGQKRVLKDHTFDNRSSRLIEIIRKYS